MSTEQGQKRLTTWVTLPEIDQCTEQDQGGIKSIEVAQVAVGQEARFVGPLAQAVLVINRTPLLHFSGFGTVNVRQ